jgi:hypothetical protein
VAANSTEALNIVINASDNAGRIVDSIGQSIGNVANQAGFAQIKMAAMGTAIVSASGAAVTKLSELNNVVSLIQRALDTSIGKQTFSLFQQSIENTLQESQKLSDVLLSFSSIATPFTKSFFGRDSAVPRQLLEDLRQLQKERAVLVSKKQNTTDVDNRIKEIEEKIAAAQSPLEQKVSTLAGNIAKKLIETIPNQLSGNQILGDALSKALSFGVDQFINSKLPLGLGSLGQGALGAQLKGVALPKDVQEAMAQNFFQGLEGLIKSRIEKGLLRAIDEVDASSIAATSSAEEIGKIFADVVSNDFNLSEITEEFLDEQIVAGDFIEKLFTSGGIPGNLANIIAPIIRSNTAQFKDLILEPLRQLDQPVKDALSDLIVNSFANNPDIKNGIQSIFNQLNASSGGILADIGARLGARLGGAFARGFGSVALQDVIGQINRIDAVITNTVARIQGFPARLSSYLDAAAAPLAGLSGATEPLQVLDKLKQGAAGLSQAIFAVSENLFFLTSGFQALQQLVVGGPFELLIGQNARLQDQLLATQASIVSTSQVVQQGYAIADPTTAINALQAPIEAAIAKLRQGSLELSGVTSQDLIPLFQQIVQEGTRIGATLDDSVELSLKFAAALGTLNIPLYQSRQEIGSILQGNIDNNSILAKTLGLTNDQVEKWIAQGTAVEELNKRLEAFRAGNRLSANTLTGLTSNIKEIFDEVGRRAGAPLLKPILVEVRRFYDFLNQSLGGLTNYFSKIAGQLLSIALAASGGIEALFNSLGGIAAKIPDFLFTALTDAVITFVDAIKLTLQILQPVINVFSVLATTVTGNFGWIFTLLVQIKTLQLGIIGLSNAFGILTNIMPFVGDLLFLLNLRANGFLNTMAILKDVVGTGGAGFLLFGKYLDRIPGATAAVAKQLGPLGSVFAGLIPTVAGFGVSVVGLVQNFPLLGTAISSIIQQMPGAIAGLANFAKTANIGGISFAAFAPIIEEAATKTQVYAKTLSSTTLLNEKFAEVSKLAGSAVRQQVAQFGLLAIGAGVAFVAFDQLILKNAGAIAIFKALGAGVNAVGTAIRSFFNNSLTQAILIVTALAITVKTGLIPAIFTSVAGMAKLVSTNVLGGLAALSKLMRGLVVSVTQFSVATAQTGISSLTASFLKFSGVLTILAGDVLQVFADGLKKIGMTTFAQAANFAGSQVQQAGLSMALAGNAAGGLANSVNLAKVSFVALGQAALTATKAIVSGILTVAKAVAPLLVLIATVTTITEIFAGYQRQQEALISQAKIYNDTVAETAKRLDELRRQRFGADTTEGADPAVKRLKEIQEEQNVVTKFFDGMKGAAERFGNSVKVPRFNEDGSFKYKKIEIKTDAEVVLEAETKSFDDQLKESLKSLAKIKETTDEQVKLEKDRIVLVRRRAEAESRGEDSTVKTLDAQISKVEEEIQVRKDAVDAIEQGIKKINFITTEQQKAQDDATQAVKNYRTELDRIPDTKIKPPKLPELGLAVDQLKSRYANALAEIRKEEGTPEQFEAKAKQFIEVGQKLLELGVGDEKKYLEDLLVLSKNSNASLETQLAAKEKIYEIAGVRLQKTIQRSEQQRLLEIQKLENAALLTATQADEQRENAKLKTLTKELDIQRRKQKLAAELYGKDSDAAKNAQDEVNKLLQQSLELQESVYKKHIATIKEVLARQVQIVTNTVDQENQQYQKRLTTLDAFNKGLEQQNSLLQAGRQLSEAANNYRLTGLDALKRVEPNEAKQQKIARITADIKLKTLEQAQRYEQRSLEIEIEKNRIMLEREAIQNRINQSTAVVDVVKSDAEYQTALKDKNVTPEERERLRIIRDANVDKYRALQDEGDFIQKRRGQLGEEEAAKRKTLDLTQRSQRIQARVEFFETGTEAQKAKGRRSLRDDLAKEAGFDSYQQLTGQGDRLARQDYNKQFGLDKPTNYGYVPDIPRGIPLSEQFGQLQAQTQQRRARALERLELTPDSKQGERLGSQRIAPPTSQERQQIRQGSVIEKGILEAFGRAVETLNKGKPTIQQKIEVPPNAVVIQMGTGQAQDVQKELQRSLDSIFGQAANKLAK